MPSTRLGTDLEFLAGATDCTDDHNEQSCGGPCNDLYPYTNGFGPSPGCGSEPAAGAAAPPPEPDCESAIDSDLANTSHLDVVLRILNENSYGLGYTDLYAEDFNIASVLYNRTTNPRFRLLNGQDSSNIDNQAKYAGNPSSLT